MTIHKIDDHVLEAIKALAEKNGESINATIKGLLSRVVGVESGGGSDPEKSGYRRFLGRWSSGEAEAFERATEEFSKVDAGDWQL